MTNIIAIFSFIMIQKNGKYTIHVSVWTTFPFSHSLEWESGRRLSDPTLLAWAVVHTVLKKTAHIMPLKMTRGGNLDPRRLQYTVCIYGKNNPSYL